MLMKLLFMVLAAALVSGCAQHQVRADDPVQELIAEDVRYSRYTLVSTRTATDPDLLAQIVDTRIPATMTPTLKDALAYVLQRTGFALCAPPTPEVETLFSRPLPAVHYRVGPTPLREALSLLAGSAYQVEVDDITRTICFAAKPVFLPRAVAVAEIVDAGSASAKEEGE
jgi:conjugative transfer region protein (TIGR03748 family)